MATSRCRLSQSSGGPGNNCSVKSKYNDGDCGQRSNREERLRVCNSPFAKSPNAIKNESIFMVNIIGKF
jgi:hypothetical protein